MKHKNYKDGMSQEEFLATLEGVDKEIADQFVAMGQKAAEEVFFHEATYTAFAAPINQKYKTNINILSGNICNTLGIWNKVVRN